MIPFNNKTKFDPGRLNKTIEFYKQQSTPTPSGGSKLTTVLVSTKKAGELPLNNNGQLEILAGASVLNDDRNFVIRAEKDFTPVKAMNIRYDGNYYSIGAITPLDNPVHYYKVLALRKADYDNWIKTIV